MATVNTTALFKIHDRSNINSLQNGRHVCLHFLKLSQLENWFVLEIISLMFTKRHFCSLNCWFSRPEQVKLKQYYEMWREVKTKIMKLNLLSTYFKLSVYSCWMLCVIWKYSTSYSIPQYKVQWDPSKGKVNIDFVQTVIPITRAMCINVIFVNIQRFQRIHTVCFLEILW